VAQKKLGSRVREVADELLRSEGLVSAVDLCVGLGWVAPPTVDNWRQGRFACFEDTLPVDGAKTADALDHLRRWAEDKGLTREDVYPLSSSRDHHRLRYSKSGDPATEQVWAVSWLGRDLPPAVRTRIVEKEKAAPDLVVVMPVNDWTCAECGDTGDLLIMDDAGPLCMTCSDLDHLLFLPAGDAALTRRSKKASQLSAVVVRWSKTRKRYERQGLLVEEVALEQAEQQCLADEDIRMRRRERDRERRADQDVEFQERFAAAIRRQYPGCPAGRAEGIAAHAALRGSGRVGRSAAARVLDERAVTLAVVASVRHLDTDYDELLMDGVPRADARDSIRADIDRVLDSWRLRLRLRLAVTVSGYG
jgi:hypothetical protein